MQCRDQCSPALKSLILASAQSVICFATTIVTIVAAIVSPLSLSTPKADPGAHESVVALDIPTQPLATALEHFMEATNVAVVVDAAVTAGRVSAAVQGSFSPDEALRVLLTGTDLGPRPIGARAYTLVLLPRTAASRPPSRFVNYAAAIQQAVTNALCRRDETRPTHYRAVIRLWLSPGGEVIRVELAHTTGSSSLDLAIGDSLERLDVGAPTPNGLPQPVKLAILPRPINEPGCPSDGTGDRPASDLGR
jgi:hypothetical protein